MQGITQLTRESGTSEVEYYLYVFSTVRTTLDFFGFMLMAGMREEYRKARVDKDQCRNPGPHQHGFEEVLFT